MIKRTPGYGFEIIAAIALAAGIMLASGCDRPVDVSTMSLEERLGSERTSVVQAARHELFAAGPQAAADLLDHPDARTRGSAARVLGWHGDSLYLELLFDVADDPDRYVRMAAIFSIGRCADSIEVVEQLLPYRQDADGGVRAEARDAILYVHGKWGPP